MAKAKKWEGLTLEQRELVVRRLTEICEQGTARESLRAARHLFELDRENRRALKVRRGKRTKK